MRRIFLYQLMAVIFLANACKKIDVEPEDGTPVFTADILVDGTPSNLTGGVDGVYMFTSFEKDENDVYSFIGKLQLKDCQTECGESLEIRIRDFQAVPPNILDMEEALKTGSRDFRAPYMEGDSTLIIDTIGLDYMVSFSADSISTNPVFGGQLIWEFPGGGSGMGGSPSYLLDTIDENTQVVLRNVISTGQNTCESTQSQYLKINEPERCAISIQPVISGNMLSDLLAVPEGNTVGGWIWDNGSLDTLYGDTTINNTFDVFAEVNFQQCDGSASFQKSGIVPLNFLQVCRAIFTYDIQEIPVTDSTYITGPADSLDFRQVTIVYTDKNGIEYSSDKNIQSIFPNFEIIKTDGFDDNENGEPTKKIKLRFKCQVWNEGGGAKTIESASDIVFGVAYPR